MRHVDKPKPRILLVEDNRHSRNALALLFAGEGYDVVPAADGEEGFLLAVNVLPDLIITDLDMPNGPGLELVAMLKADPKTKDMPVVVTSGAEDEYLDMAAELGVDCVVKKPFDFDVFLDLVAGLISGSGIPASINCRKTARAGRST